MADNYAILSKATQDQRSWESTVYARKSLPWDIFLKKRFENNASGQVIYVGFALPGTATSSAAWAIKKLTYDGFYITQEDWADGVNTFTKVWDDRATYTYG